MTGDRTRDLPITKRMLYQLGYHGKVGLAGFEPATPSSRTRCATKLRYSPKSTSLIPDSRGRGAHVTASAYSAVSLPSLDSNQGHLD